MPIGGIPSNDKGIRGAFVTDDSAQVADAIITINYLMETNNDVIPTAATIQISGVQGFPAEAINLIRVATA